MAKENEPLQQGPASQQRVITKEEIDNLSNDAAHIQSLTILAIERLDATIDQESDALLAVIKDKAERLLDLAGMLYEREDGVAHG